MIVCDFASLLPPMIPYRNPDEHIYNEQMRLSVGRAAFDKIPLSLEQSSLFLLWDCQNGKCDFLRFDSAMNGLCCCKID